MKSTSHNQICHKANHIPKHVHVNFTVPDKRLQSTSRLLAPPTYPPLATRFSHLSPIQRLIKRILSMLECRLFVAIGNSRKWRGLVLPSSNGFVSARAVASMYGAIVNQGALADGMQHPCFHHVFGLACMHVEDVQPNLSFKLPQLPPSHWLLTCLTCSVTQDRKLSMHK
jgi:hypothetical protein